MGFSSLVWPKAFKVRNSATLVGVPLDLGSSITLKNTLYLQASFTAEQSQSNPGKEEIADAVTAEIKEMAEMAEIVATQELSRAPALEL